ncbi:VQ motif containing protein [Parasponia andersonii]|uniref:VQ motif containing protein n=1 Tax=Parasponia andersonii TaxID=3476 RepID=A0A2P5D7C7_PARAD|nr:VQ motif containing protein [Parasponia andersonii]
MENLMVMKPKSLNPSSASGDHNKVLAMHKDSHMISKLMKPKIRIIHVFAPEIIKTDVANFRELVQSLTGKAASGEAGRQENGSVSSSSNDDSDSRGKMVEKQGEKIPSCMEMRGECGHEKVVKDERQDYMWRSSTSGDHHDHQRVNSFLEGFSDLNGFYDDQLSEFPSLLQLKSSRADVFHELDPKL